MRAQTFDQRIATRAIRGLNAIEMDAEITAIQELGERELIETGAAEIGRVLERHQVRLQRSRSDHVTDAQRGNEPLAERADVNDLGIQSAHRRRKGRRLEL